MGHAEGGCAFILNFTRPPPKRDSSCRLGTSKDLQVFSSNAIVSEPLLAADHRLGQHCQDGTEKIYVADPARMQHSSSSRVDYLRHRVIPRLLGFQISHHDKAERTESPSILTISRAWLACEPAISSQGSAITAQAEA